MHLNTEDYLHLLHGFKFQKYIEENKHDNEERKWANSHKIYVKRVSVICLLKSTKTFIVNVLFEEFKEISDILTKDSHIYIQKGIEWLLKYAYLSYPEEIIKYLNNNLNIMSRTTFRYALEKMPENLKRYIMAK